VNRGEKMRPIIYYDLNKSRYFYQSKNFLFVFSSEFYENKFSNKVKENRKDLKYKLSSRFNIDFECNDYFDIILYTQVEKRGFLIKSLNSEVVFECLNQVKLGGVIKTLKN